MKKNKMIKYILVLSAILIIKNYVQASTEHVVFERIGSMSGATSFIHVHVTLGMGLITKQIDVYRDLLENTFGKKDNIIKMFRKHMPPPPARNMSLKYKVDTPSPTEVREDYYGNVAVLWMNIARQHREDVLDMYLTLASLQNTMPDLPDREVKKISARSDSKNERFTPHELVILKDLAHAQGIDYQATIDTHRQTDTPAHEVPHIDHLSVLDELLGKLPTIRQLNAPKPLMSEETLRAKSTTRRPLVNGDVLLPLPHLKRRKRELARVTNRLEKITSNSSTVRQKDKVLQRLARRSKRLAGAIALPLAIAATAMGIYNTEQINFLKTELGKLQDSQDRLFDIMYRHESMLEEISNAIQETAAAMVAILIFNPALFSARLTRIENQIRTKLTKTTHALQSGLIRKLAVDYLTPGEIRLVFDELVETAKRLKCDLLIDHHSDLFQMETSLLFDGQDAHLLVHVPMVPHKALLRLYKLHPIPLPLDVGHFLIPDVKNDVLAISANDNRYALQLSSMDLLGCYRANQLFMCDRFGVLSRGYNDTCLGSLYNQQFEAAQHLCKFEVAPITERVYQLKKHHFLIYLPKALTLPIKCRNGTTTERHLSKGHQEVFISPGCEAEFDKHRIMTDSSITFPADIIHFEWQWDAIDATNFMDTVDIPAELLRLANTGITRPTLADLQFLALTKQKITEMVKPEDWGLSTIHRIATGILTCSILFLVGYVAYRFYRRRQANNLNRPPEPVIKSNPGITIVTGMSPTAPRSPAYSVDDEDQVPLRRKHRWISPVRNHKHRYSEQNVRYNVHDEDVSFSRTPYSASQNQVDRETLKQRRKAHADRLAELDDELDTFDAQAESDQPEK